TSPPESSSGSSRRTRDRSTALASSATSACSAGRSRGGRSSGTGRSARRQSSISPTARGSSSPRSPSWPTGGAPSWDARMARSAASSSASTGRVWPGGRQVMKRSLAAVLAVIACSGAARAQDDEKARELKLLPKPEKGAQEKLSYDTSIERIDKKEEKSYQAI